MPVIATPQARIQFVDGPTEYAPVGATVSIPYQQLVDAHRIMRSRTEDRSHDLAVLRGRRTGGGVSRLLQATSSSWSVRWETAGTQGGPNLSTVAGIARRPAPLVIVEVHKEGESLLDTAFPPHQVDRLRELADGLRSEVLLTPFSEDVGGVERSVPAAVVDDISPDLEHPQSPHQALVDRTNGRTANCARSCTSRPNAVRR